MQFVHATVFRVEVLLAGLPVAQGIRTIHKAVITVLVDVRLHMTAGHDLRAALRPERTLDPNVIAHVDQKPGHVEVDISCRRSAGRTREFVSTGGKAGDGGVETFLTEHMVALQAYGADERTVADGTHQMVIVAGDVIKGA
jgi:hypothetical protein